MNKKIILIWLIFVTASVFADGNKVYSVTEYSWLYDDLDKLMLESKISPLSSTYPYTGNEIEFILNKIPVNSLSNVGNNRYNKVLKAIDSSNNKDGFTYDFELDINIETYLQANKGNEEWIYDYYDRQALLELDFEFGINDFFWAGVSIPFQKGMNYNDYSEGAESNLSLLWNLDQIDAQFPYFAISSIGGDNWSILFGRDLLDYGIGETGSFSISDDASYHDFIKASTFWDKFKYTFTIVNIDAIDVETDTKSDDGKKYGSFSDDGISDIKLFIDHTFEFRPFDNWSFAINDITIRGGGPVTLAHLNPFALLHNVTLTDRHDTIYGNSLLTISSTYTPLNNFNIYTEYALDQYLTSSEKSRNSEDYDSDPNAWGLLGGIKYQLTKENISTLFNAEVAYTNPHLYRSTNSWSIYAITRYYHNVYNDSNDAILESLGYQYGPDTIVIKLSADTTLLDGDLSIYFEYLNITQGESDLTDYADSGSEAFDMKTPSGDTIFKRNIFTLNAEYQINSWASVYSQVNALLYNNVDNEDGEDITDFQIVLGTNLNFF